MRVISATDSLFSVTIPQVKAGKAELKVGR
jgi:hypothetical protein